MSAFFVTGIDTDVGKTLVTGLLARGAMACGARVITQKLVQTGCVGIPEDVARHREIMGLSPATGELAALVCPYVFSYPGSPHLAARVDGEVIDPARLAAATRALEERHDVVLVEGAGGLYVPLTRDYFIIDHVRDQRLPLILVTSARLGSINHTMLALEACRREGIRVAAVVFNRYPRVDGVLERETRIFLRERVEAGFPGCRWLKVPLVKRELYPLLDAWFLLDPA
ncbi:MAG: dethiobiotin synthase [Odoribacteraceae bacterium]|jgi:dethiobiotin synthetase|nr:dethiobiotin synthase [Odoribacteraceae bacterium]